MLKYILIHKHLKIMSEIYLNKKIINFKIFHGERQTIIQTITRALIRTTEDSL